MRKTKDIKLTLFLSWIRMKHKITIINHITKKYYEETITKRFSRT